MTAATRRPGPGLAVTVAAAALASCCHGYAAAPAGRPGSGKVIVTVTSRPRASGTLGQCNITAPYITPWLYNTLDSEVYNMLS